MNTHTRRSFVALAGMSALFGTHVAASPSRRIHVPSSSFYSCGANMGTPVVEHIESDIPFDQAYIDTTIPYHQAAIALTEVAKDDLEDERLIEIADAILETHPDEIEELRSFREEIFGDPEPEEPTHEMMLLSMGGVESCTDQSHMDFMKSEWVEETYEKNDDKEFAYVGMMVLLLEMELHQHMVGVELAENDDLREFCERLTEAKTPQVRLLKDIRGEMISRY